ncbi:MAG: hypothetical protein IKO16_03965 [Lachnospiraceae bacterium]|nr:hypothetical protein [Lachnospiraceae bacterium]
MTFDDYIKHYTDTKSMLLFLALALAFSVICVFYILMVVSISARFVDRSERKQFYYEKAHNTIQRFYEMVFAGASILSFLAIYYIIDRFVPDSSLFRKFWDNWKDFLLLFLILLSIVVNNIIDRLLIPLKKVTKNDRGSVRLLGMVYVLLIFAYIKFIYENDNYDGFIMYFLGLMIGRFVYFDVSFRESIQTFIEAMKNFPILILGLAYTAFMAYTGFGSGYLLIGNGVLVSTFIAHLYMIVAIFIIHHSHFMYIFARKPKAPHVKRAEHVRRDYDDEPEYEDLGYAEPKYEDPVYDEKEYDDLEYFDPDEY